MIILKEDKRKLGREEVHKVRMWEKTEYCQVRRVLSEGKLGLSNA